MQSVYVFIFITKIADFQCKNVDVSRTHELRQVIYLYFFKSFLGKVQLPSFIIVGYV